MQNSDYPIVSKKDSKELAKFLAEEGQFLLPMLDLIEQANNRIGRLFGACCPDSISIRRVRFLYCFSHLSHLSHL